MAAAQGAAAAAAAAAIVAAALAEAAEIEVMLLHCGFTDPQERLDISRDGFEGYSDMNSLREKDISELAKAFADRTQANGRITFGLRRQNLLKSTIHWVQDFRRISRSPTLDDITDVNNFRAKIQTARERALVRKSRTEDSSSSQAADPGKCKGSKGWLVWSRALKNYLSTILGQDGVPLSYIIRDEEAPDYELEHEIFCDYEQLTVDCAPLSGTIFSADAKTVHQLIHGFIQGETAETWTRRTANRKNGRLDYQALKAHYEGEGNKQIRLDEAEQLRKSLMYKNERVLSFEKFLTSMQKMFQGFYDAGEEYLEPQKIRVLFEKIQSPALQMAKSSLMVAHDLDTAGTVTYDFIANSLSVQATGQAPDHATNRNTSALGRGEAVAPDGGVTSNDGTIFTGYYPNWRQLTDANKQSVYDERKRLDIKNSPKGKKPPYKGRQASATKAKKKEVVKLNRKISSLKAKLKSASSIDDDDNPEEVQDNAGDQFGGRKKKKENKSG
jgi:hypothetical protein